VYLEGATAVTLPTIQLIPSLAQTIPQPFNADEAAADHQTLFGFNVFPYESIFLDGSGLLGGTTTDAVLNSYQEAGFQVKADSTSPDHIGHELHLLAHLCAAEADAWQDDRGTIAKRMRHMQYAFLQNHLLPWLVPFVMAVKAEKRPFFTALAQLTLDFIHDHYAEISPQRHEEKYAAPVEPLRLNLKNEKTGLKQIAQFLATPPYSGFYLSRDTVAQLARAQNIPRGFGDRTQMLTNLLRGAAQFDALPALVDSLQTVITTWQDAYADYAASMPALAPFAAVWQERISQTGRMLSQIDQQLEALA
jgi:TorA maturation chaperone TorD